MQPGTRDTLHDLLEQGHAAAGFSADIYALGKHWVRICVELGGAGHAWFAKLEDGHFQWVAEWPENTTPVLLESQPVNGIIQSKKPVFFFDKEEASSGGIFPMLQDGRVIGLLGLSSQQTDFFQSSTISWIKSLVELASFNIARLEMHARKAQLEDSIRQTLLSGLNVKEALPSFLEVLLELVHAKAALVLKYNPVKKQFDLLATKGFEAQALARVYFYVQDGLAKRVVEEYHTILDDYKLTTAMGTSSVSSFVPEGMKEHIALPLMGQSEMVGILEIFWQESQGTKTWIPEILQLAGKSIAAAIENCQAVEDLRQRNQELASTFTATIEGLSRALELRDLETEGHTRRVSVLAVRLAERFNMQPDQQEAIEQGALLHDIGKLGIPDAILLKPGSLTPHEWKIMQQHPLYAYKILAPIISLQKALEIPLYHHERWDGSGYPYGLKEKQIPLSARLFAVVDVYDALTSDRPYRAAWSKSQALAYFSEQSGVLFDPQVVEEFLAFLEELK